MKTSLGLLHLEFHVLQAASLKDKRRLVKSFKDRLAAERNVSVAEVAKLDSIRQAVLAVAMVGNDARYIEGALQQVVNTARAYRLWVLMDYELEMV